MSTLSKETLDFRPCAGLANRLRAMVSAICAAEDLGWKLRVWWPIEPGIHAAPFSDLFQVPKSFPPDLVTLEERWHSATELLVKNQEEWNTVSRRLKTSPLQMLCYLKSYYRFHTADNERWLKHLRNLKPLEQHMRRVEECLAPAAGRPLIGIHIRRTDHAVSIKHSPTDVFLKSMRRVFALHPKALFFIASDDDRERLRIKQEFGKRVLTLAETLDRTSIEGGVDALLDFIALSKCTEIWGSVHSSFCELAAQYGGIPYTQLGTPFKPQVQTTAV